MSEQQLSIEIAVLERRIKFLEDEARINKDFRGYVIKRCAAGAQPETNPFCGLPESEKPS